MAVGGWEPCFCASTRDTAVGWDVYVTHEVRGRRFLLYGAHCHAHMKEWMGADMVVRIACLYGRYLFCKSRMCTSKIFQTHFPSDPHIMYHHQ